MNDEELKQCAIKSILEGGELPIQHERGSISEDSKKVLKAYQEYMADILSLMPTKQLISVVDF
jgi:hypothetical protein